LGDECERAHLVGQQIVNPYHRGSFFVDALSIWNFSVRTLNTTWARSWPVNTRCSDVRRRGDADD
jgi:hypothetical protein